MQWDDVRMFLSLAREGSLSGAARALDVEHSTISRRVTRLEETLGVRLFDRLARGWRLTEEGHAMRPLAEAIEEDALALTRTAQGFDALSGRVRVSAPPVLLVDFIMDRLAGLFERLPGIDLDLIGETRQANMLQAEAHIAVRLGQPGQPDLIAREVAHVGYGLYARSDAPRNSLIGFHDGEHDHAVKRWADAHLTSYRKTIQSNDLAVQAKAARSGRGVALLPHFMARLAPELAPVQCDAPLLSRPVFLVMHPDIRRSRRARAVFEELVEIFQTSSDVLAGPAHVN